MALAPAAWTELRLAISRLLAIQSEGQQKATPHLHAMATAELFLPVRPGGFVDFFASIQHATNAGSIFRPDAPLLPNYKHVPIGYNGRTSTIMVSGLPVRRPCGQTRPTSMDGPVFGPSQRLDFEAELGIFVGGSNKQGVSIPLRQAWQHIFGFCLLNDWSARDIQRWEARPLGPLLGKAFGTSISCWVTPWEELAAARVDPPPRDPEPLPYLRGPGDQGLDLALEVRLNGEVISRPPGSSLYWTAPQFIAHLTSGGATLRPGDLLGSGTMSGPERNQRGSLLELSWGGTDPLPLADGGTLTYLRDGDELLITASGPGLDGARVELGEVRGQVLPAHTP